MHARESPFHLATLRAHPQGIHSWPELHHILFKLDAVVLEQELLFHLSSNVKKHWLGKFIGLESSRAAALPRDTQLLTLPHKRSGAA